MVKTRLPLALFCCAMFLGGCKPSAEQMRWEYEVFQWDGTGRQDPDKPNQILMTVVETINVNANTGTHEDDKEVADLESLLTVIGQHGWELVWSDGKTFIAKRPIGHSDHSAFTITHRWEDLPK